MIKFKAIHFNAIGHKIEQVEVARETAALVYLPGGERENKKTEWHSYHNTWDDAHAALMDHAESQLKAAHRRLQQVQLFWGTVKGMKKPKTVAA